MVSPYSFKDHETGWNKKNKTRKQKALLSFRGKLLNHRMAYPLEYKVMLAKRRILMAINKYGKDNCYIGFSGGKDSTILSHIILSMGYKLDHVFSNTRLEYPECIKFSKKWCNKKKVKLNLVLPDMLPKQIWKKYGYPMFSKEVADILERMRLGYKVADKKIVKAKGFLKRLGYEGNPKHRHKLKEFFKKKHIKISAKCCYILKKKPMQDWQKRSGKHVAIMGVRAQESQARRVLWVRKGCIYETKEQVAVNPIVFFTDKDIWDYAKRFKIKFADIYYKPHNMKRNGCYCCGFGGHRSKENNFVKLKQMNPILWKGVTNHWGFSKMCKKCKIKIE